MSCGCGKRREERLAAKRAVQANELKTAYERLAKFGPARWDGKPKQLEAKSE